MATRTKKAALSPADIAIRNIEKSMGNKGNPLIHKIENSENFTIEAFSLGFPSADKATNCGGVPRGKMIEIFGPESSGKSLLSLKAIASAQKKGLTCCLVDAEQSFDPRWAKKQGVDVENNFYIFNEAMGGEKILDYIDGLCKSGAFGLVVVDSTAALVPQKELDGSVADQDYALLARAMSKGCKKIVNSCKIGDCCCIFINQIRENMNAGMFGNPNTTPGGKALKFYSSMRINVSCGAKVKGTDENGETQIIARKSWFTVVKNKVASPFGSGNFEIIFDEMSMNPLVKMVKAAKVFGIFNIYKKQYTLDKNLVEGAKKNVPTGAFSLPELAHYCLNEEGMMDLVLDELLELIEDEYDEKKLESVDPVIEKLKSDKSLWVSPLGKDYKVTVEEKEIKSPEEIIAEQGDELTEEDLD